MKNISFRKWSFGILPLIVFAITLLSSCNKDNDGGGQPVIESVYALDTTARHKDSTFKAAEPYVLLVINGSNINGVIKAYFNEYETSFNTNYNTSTKLIIRVPAEAPTDSTANNMIRLVTVNGEATYSFKIIAKPSIVSVDKLNYGDDGGRNITFKGKNFADMVRVVAFREKETPTEIVKDSVVCQIVSKASEKLVVRIPSNTISRVTLNFTNSSGTVKGTDVFVNADLAFKIFTEDFGTVSDPVKGDGKWGGDSWGNSIKINSDAAYSGQKSLSVVLDVGGWKWFGASNWWPRYHYDTSFKYITFAIKGGENVMPLWISSEITKDGGLGGFPDKNRIEVQPKIWNYYRIAIADLDLMDNGVKEIPRIGFRPKGPDKPDLLYIDDFMLVK